MRVSSSVGLGVVCIVGASALGAFGAALYLAPATPPALAGSRNVKTVPVATVPFADERPVELQLTFDPPVQITSPVDGVVTAFRCTPNGALDPSISSLSIDGVPLLTIATPTPLWRDISPGDTGADVQGVQDFLNGRGGDLTADGTAGPRTIAELVKLARSAGQPDPSTTMVQRAALLWIPYEGAPVSKCSAALGQAVAAGTEVATVAGGLRGADVDLGGQELLPGAREIRVSGESFPLDADSRIRDPEALSRIVGTPAYRDALADGASSLKVTMSLVEPVEAASVPPSALVNVGPGTGCIVAADHSAVAVEILGSKLGQTLIRASSGRLPGEVDIRPGEDVTCD